MTEPVSHRHKTICIGGAISVLLIILILTLSRPSAKSPDDPSELLRRASSSSSSITNGPEPTGKVLTAEATSSSGTTVQARMLEFRQGNRQAGYAITLPTPLKPGASTTIKPPGGGVVIMGVPKDGQPPKLPDPSKPTPAR